MHDYKAKTSLMVLVAASLALASCSKAPVEAAPEQTTPEQAALEQTAQEPVAEKIEPAKQAATIAGYIDDRPECATYREQLEAANTTATSADLVAVLETAHKAGCSKKK